MLPLFSKSADGLAVSMACGYKYYYALGQLEVELHVE